MEEGKAQDWSAPEPAEFKTKQLSLFTDFLVNSEKEREKLSNIMNFWDSMPKYSVTKQRQNKIRQGRYLPKYERTFNYKGDPYTIEVSPARTGSGEEEKEYYPSVMEEFVENALRKLACEPEQIYFSQKRGRVGVTFSLHQLRKELKERGHYYRCAEIKQSLEILSQTKIKVEYGGKMILTSPITNLVGVSEEESKKDKKARWYVEFSLFLSLGLMEKTYRQYNYELMMGLRGQLTRWIYKRLASRYTQASIFAPYSCSLKMIKQESGLLNTATTTQDMRFLVRSLEELVEKNVLMDFQVDDPERGPRNKILNIGIHLRPSMDFIDETKRANKRFQIKNKE
ncbi:hypothetical protein JWG39_15560 [Desulforhopalus vacuolatus]|uniref:hypothetical protein n=1 Tax=Desulforhopalus vacuolatus TaxID=40414 RepID=UPI0019627245|nr:hypothetical protein [Desulforhopalus vacuolatus]MBM9521237.1 hypothetical protein [Desulforhopalus vacuolatus]